MSENTGQPVSVAAFLGTFGAGLTTIASVISDVLTPLAPVSLYLGLPALVAFGTSYRSCALGLSLQNNDYDLTGLLLDLGADKSVGEYHAYSVALAKQAKLPAGEQRDTLEELMERLEPPGRIRKQQELRQRLVEVEKELTDVAMEGLRAFTASEKARTGRRYDELQVERKKLQDAPGIEAN